MSKRINSIDNLRWMTVSLLILYHAAMAYNTWGEANYIFFEKSRPLSAFISFVSPWFMPLMFMLAGASSYFSLQKRSMREFITERAKRLGIPFVFGLTVINPVMSYTADVTHNGYKGGYLAHYGIYFSRFTDLSGYDGGFTLGHLWFIAVLLIISLLACAFIRAAGQITASKKKAAVFGTVLFACAAAAFGIDILGKKVITYFCVYLLGYYFVSSVSFVEKLSHGKWIFTAAFLVFSTANVALFLYIDGFETLNSVCNHLAFAAAMPALLCLGHDCLDFSNSFTKKNTAISYVFYIIHFPITVLCQYLLDLAGVSVYVNLILTLVICYPLTYLACLAIDRSRYVRVLFGSKARPADR